MQHPRAQLNEYQPEVVAIQAALEHAGRVHVPTPPNAPPGEHFGAVVATQVANLAPAGAGNAKGFSEGPITFWRGVVRDAREDLKGQVEDKGVGYAEGNGC